MNSTTPFFSIIIPMFNTEKYIGECLDSIMMQNFSDYEVIVVDDGSTDGSCEIVSRYIKGKLNINLLKQKNSGVSAARNLGIEKARGKYIIFVDSDDFLVNESLEFLMNTLLENNDLDMLFFNYYEVGSKKMNKHIFRPQFLGKKISENTAIQGLLTDVGGFCWNKVYKRSLLLDSRFDTQITFLEDLLFNVSVVTKAKRIMSVGNYLYGYRWREDSIIHTFQSRNMSFFNALNKIQSKISKEFDVLIDVKRRMAYIEFASNFIFLNRVEYSHFKKMFKKMKSFQNFENNGLTKTEKVSLHLSNVSFGIAVIALKTKFKVDRFKMLV